MPFRTVFKFAGELLSCEHIQDLADACHGLCQHRLHRDSWDELYVLRQILRQKRECECLSSLEALFLRLIDNVVNLQVRCWSVNSFRTLSVIVLGSLPTTLHFQINSGSVNLANTCGGGGLCQHGLEWDSRNGLHALWQIQQCRGVHKDARCSGKAETLTCTRYQRMRIWRSVSR